MNPTQIHDSLQNLVAKGHTAQGTAFVPLDFITGFMASFGMARATVDQVRTGGARNIAKEPMKYAGHVGIKNQFYFFPCPDSTSSDARRAAIQTVLSDPLCATHKLRFVLTTDGTHLMAYDKKADDWLDIEFSELPRHYAFFLPLAGYEKARVFEESGADVKAADRMGKLFDVIKEHNDISSPGRLHSLNIFLTRVLFCYFAEDTGIFSARQFTSTLESTTSEDGSDLGQFLSDVFAVMNIPERGAARKGLPAHITAFPYVNGGLFAEDEWMPVLTRRARSILIECGTLDWAEINPDIFGSMFQAVVDASSRANLGQHYTSVANIMKVIQPLFLDALYEELEASRKSAKRLKELLGRIGRIKVFDPACGSGNFLIIAYKELRKLEIAALRALSDLGQQEMFMSSIRLSSFYGIEIDDFPSEIARLSLWLAEHQMNKVFEEEFGYAEPSLPLKNSGNIVHANSLRVDWEIVCPRKADDEVYIIGNPPFLGTTGRSDAQSADMEAVFAGFKSLGYLDLVAAWFWKASNYIKGTKAKSALVSTNSICQGEQVATLWPQIFALGVEISFAYRTFSWSNSARDRAAVHVVIIGLSAGRVQSPVIFDLVGGNLVKSAATCIGPYLNAGSTAAVFAREKPFGHKCQMVKGSQASDGGNFFLTSAELASLSATDPRVSRYVRSVMGADEFINGKRRWCLWMADADLRDLEEIPVIRARLDNIRALRLKAGHPAALRGAESPNAFLQDAQPRVGNYIMVPAHSSENRLYIPMGFLSHEVIATNANLMVPNGTLYDFGILTSEIHNDWMRAVAGRLESRYRYSATIVYNTFPWPNASEEQRKHIEAMAEEVLMTRENYPDKNLAWMYDPDTMPEDLKAAHKTLDRAVDALYRNRPFKDASERLELLFSMYEKLIEQERQQQAAAAAVKSSRGRGRGRAATASRGIV